MSEKNIIENINKLFYGLMKEASRSSFVEFIEYWGISETDFEEIQEYFNMQGIEIKPR